MSDQKLMMALHKSFSPHFKKMTQRYSGYLMRIESDDASSLASAAMRYITEFKSVGVSPEDLDSLASVILDRREFATRPPGSRELAFKIKDLAEASENPVLMAISGFYERMRTRYQRLWVSQEDRDQVIKGWLDTATRYGATLKSIEFAEERLVRDPDFRKYPPTTEVIDQAIRIASYDESLPLISESYSFAVSCSDSCHPIIKKSRSGFGAHLLRTRTDMRVKPDFEQYYARILDEFLSGKIRLDDSFQEQDSIEQVSNEDPLTAEQLINFLKIK
jgi:hypothetical protein